MLNSRNITLLPSVARTTNHTSDTDQGCAAEHTEAVLFVDVTAVSGTTPSLTIVVETSWDGATWWTHTSLTAITATGKVRQTLQFLGTFLRLNDTITGTTPSFTFSAVMHYKRPGGA
jgi:hypothetical protein